MAGEGWCSAVINFFRNGAYEYGGTRKAEVRQKTWVEREIEKQEATEKAEKALLEKRTRVYSRWNDFKSIFGCGEKLTSEEAKKLVEIDARKRFIQNGSRETLDDRSVWEIE